MFAATQDDDGNWRLSVRRIRTITGFYDSSLTRYDVKFSSRAKAKHMADMINDVWSYSSYWDERTGFIKPDVDRARALVIRDQIIEHLKENAIVTKCDTLNTKTE